jgi:DDE family transposase/transposase-like protein DUF772
MKIVAEIWSAICSTLVPRLEECLDEPLTAKLKQLVSILEIVRIEEHVPPDPPHKMGRKRDDRRLLARAFVAKAVYNLATTQLLIEMLHLQPSLRRICGFAHRRDIPSPATFSRAFAAFADRHLADSVHQALVATYVGDKLVMHLSRDATAIEAREKPAKKPKKQPRSQKKRGRRKKGQPAPEPGLTRLQKQRDQSVEEALSELPSVCDVGTKTDAKGHKYSWVGWKAHIDWADGAIPLTVVTTSASLHDSQVAIPMTRLSASRVTSLYDLMDAAYDAALIQQTSAEAGHRAIIDANKRRGQALPMDPATAVRYRERTNAERGNSRLKDDFGGRHLRVRGHAKAHLHVMFGILALFADQLLHALVG